jgi:hypothetical protein
MILPAQEGLWLLRAMPARKGSFQERDRIQRSNLSFSADFSMRFVAFGDQLEEKILFQRPLAKSELAQTLFYTIAYYLVGENRKRLC